MVWDPRFAGSLANLLSKGAAPTTITRVWMVTYYLDTTTDTKHPQLMRQVNYPGYPAGAPQILPKRLPTASRLSIHL